MPQKRKGREFPTHEMRTLKKKSSTNIHTEINTNISTNIIIPEALPLWSKTRLDNHIKVVSWNVFSLVACLKKGFYKYLEAEEPDIICLQETKLNANEYSFPPFITSLYPYQYVHSSMIKKGYSGCLILSKLKPLECIYGFIQHSSSHNNNNSNSKDDKNNNTNTNLIKPDNLASSLEVVHENKNKHEKEKEKEKEKVETKANEEKSNAMIDKEGRIITLIFPHIYLINIYVPCARENFERLKFKLDFMNQVKTHLSLLKDNAPILCCGDLNIAHKDIDVARPYSLSRRPGLTNCERDAFNYVLQDAALVDVWRKLHPLEQRFTSFSYRGKSRLKGIGRRRDFFLLSQELLLNATVECEIRDIYYGPSDHVPLALSIQRSYFIN